MEFSERAVRDSTVHSWIKGSHQLIIDDDLLLVAAFCVGSGVAQMKNLPPSSVPQRDSPDAAALPQK